jgi:hypothetical protein
MSTNQKYWDACLIKVWRNAGSVLDAIQMYESITGKHPDESLLRTPSGGYPWKIGIRVFVAAHLEKISKRLWEQSPDQDVALLNKLQTSTYTTSKDSTNTDSSLKKEHSQYRRNRLKVGMSTLATANRNNDTNWSVVK